MYHNSGDPYAGQYPMPPPAPEQYQAGATSTPPATSSNYYPPSSSYYTPQHVTEPDYFHQQQPAPPPEPYPSYHRDSYEPQHRASYEPHHSSYDPQIYHPHPNTSYYTEDLEASSATPETPIVEKHNTATPSAPVASTSASNESPKKKGGGWHPFKRHNKQEPDVEEQLQPKSPAPVGPRLAPEDEKPTYRPSAGPEASRGASCCCYNPALTCCSVFWMLVSIAFLAGGIALMVASKIVTDKCNNECGGGNDSSDGGFSLPDNCTILCSQVLHDGLLYGGAVVTGLAGIAIIWKLFMWCCAGYSRR
ncbi:hypothetical protein K492DRAFT_171138 [Lichtheimia hyalospora FSU 10163]|nr:hypothetical protein K492DRAFT_171138 [Lichtheimia hyalospora FSU 10163]